jgi:hypothetical protein
MPNIPGISGYSQPGVFTRVRTTQRAVSVPGGVRIPCIIGLGESEEVVVDSALGSGQDGSNPDFSGSNIPDGRHFELAKTDLKTNRTTILLNDVPLTGYEDTIDTDPFDSRYDYRIESDTGRIELQRSSIRDQGGKKAKPNTANVGNGFDIGSDGSALSLIDANAPAETWTFRATSVIYDAYGDPVSGHATFTVTGSVSGTLLDAYGAPVVFVSDGVERDNGILRATIVEGTTAFERNDRFTVIVDSKVLAEGDQLVARYIAEEDLEDPEYFTDPTALFAKHGIPSTTNTLSLGASMAFENGAPGVLAVQARPVSPRRTTETLLESDNPLTTSTEGLPALASPPTPTVTDIDMFRYKLSGIPDGDTGVNIFIVDATTGDETQVFPTKVAFYSSAIGSSDADQFNDFIDPNTSGYNYSYTVVLDDEVEDSGYDGQVTAGGFSFTAASATFRRQLSPNQETGETDIGKSIRILPVDRYGDAVTSLAGTYEIISIGDGVGDSTIVGLNTTEVGVGGWTDTATDLRWELVDTADTSAYLLLTYDLQTGGTMGRGDGVKVSYVRTDDADFYDSNWAAAFSAIESEDCQIVVPLPDQSYSAIQQAAKTHVELMSSTANQRERVAFIGAQTGVTVAALLGNEEVAVEDIGVIEGVQGDDADELLNNNIEDLQNFDVSVNWGNGFRTVYFWPDTIVRNIQGTNYNIHGFYIGAAAAGYLAGRQNVAIPLTNKVLIGFSILRSKRLTTVQKNSLGGNGVCVLQPVTGGGIVLHGKTTTSSGAPEEEEISIVFIRDRIATSIRAIMRRFIGQPESLTLAADMTAIATRAFKAYQSQGLITQYRNLKLSRDEVDPRQWNISVEVQPTYPVSWIFIDISVGQF